jgi:DNA-binding NtrC family response regulator
VAVAGGEGAAVLVVDDEPAIRLLCRVNLELDGYEVREASTLDDARQALAAGDIAVTLLDMHIGNVRGVTFLGVLQEAGVPVVVVTGSTDLDGAWTKQANAVLAKPFTIDALLSTVRTLAAAR